MEKLYIVFDKIPSTSSGGLVATYIRLVELLKDDYDIEIISIFNADQSNKDQFKSNKINIINNYKINLDFVNILQYIKEKKFLKCLICIWNILYYFISIPYNRIKVRKLVKNDKVIVSSPSAAIFMSNRTDFILELHIRYEYFFGDNKLGRLQSSLMAKPSLMLFRSKIDAEKAKKDGYNASYIYNFFDNKDIVLNASIQDRKNKIIFLGRLEKQKNPDKLLNVICELKKIYPDFSLDIYGTGSLKEHIKKQIEILNLEQNVFLKGFTTNKNIYQNYSMLIMTSRDEGFPLTVIEAKANATPTITNIWGDAVYETVENGFDGFIIDDDKEMAEKIKEILTNDCLLESLCNNSLKKYADFSAKTARKRWLQILSKGG